MSEELGRLVARTRDAAELTQRQLADRMSINQSRVSRLEAGSDDSLFEAALTAIGTPRAETIAQAFKLKWTHLRQPSFDHPELPDLIETNKWLSRLFEFKQSSNVSSDLLGQTDLLFRRLQDVGTYLLGLDHQISFIGEIGVGKTTAVCKLSGLVLDPSASDDLKGMMLDTGGGRTTLCDVVVQKGERYAISVEPLADEEVYRLAGELCKSAFETKDTSTLNSSDYRPAEEVTRALRNMSGLMRVRRDRKDRSTPAVDPLETLALKSSSLDEMQSEFASRLTLWRRTKTEIEFDGSDDSAGRRWFRDTFTLINNGRHADFSIPGRIIATLPFQPIGNTSLNLTLLDTRGIDGSSIRSDIIAHFKNSRSITVLCSKWGSAPDPAIQALLKHVAETEVDYSMFKRTALMILARSGDALSMKDDLGDHVADAVEGYDIKERHAHDALDRERLPTITVFSFDSVADPATTATDAVLSKVAELRQHHVQGARDTISAIQQMLENAEKSQALEVLRNVNNDLKMFAEREALLHQDSSHIHIRLLNMLSNAHPRTIWASVRRSGSYWNFDFYQHLADGAANEIKRQNGAVFDRLRVMIQAKMDKPEYDPIRKFLSQLLNNVSDWEIDLALAVRHYAIATYRERLAQDSIWDESERLYGTGSPYRDRVVSNFGKWFSLNSNGISAELDFKFQLAWQTSLIDPLMRTAGEGFDYN